MGVELRQLAGPEGPRNFAEALGRPQEPLQTIRRVDLVAGGRKAEFLRAELEHFRVGNEPVAMVTAKTEWNEDVHKHEYMVPGLSPALKVGARRGESQRRDENNGVPSVSLATDVSLEVEGGVLHKNTEETTREEVTERLVGLLTESRRFTARSSMAGMRNDLQEGITVNTSTGFTISPMEELEIRAYVDSLNDQQLLRSPAGLLWPHELLQKHIVEVEGVGHDAPGFEEKKLELFSALLGVPKELDVLVRALDSQEIMQVVQGDNSLFATLQKENRIPVDEGFRFDGRWSEMVVAGDELYFLLEALPLHYPGMSALAEDNFRNAPNYAYLRSPGHEEELQKYIAANSPGEMADTCQRVNRLTNHVLVNANGEVVGFRIVRKEGEKADGRRIHTSRFHGGRGLGGVLMDRSEEYAKAAGCISMEVHATGSSSSFFEARGYENLGQTTNHRGVFADKPSGYYLMQKSL